MDELRHKDVGSNLSQTEWEAIGSHIFNSQATGDIMYASSATQLTRLAKGATNTVLVMGASIPAWSATLAGLTLTAPTLNGTVTLGSTPIFDAGSGSAQINTTGAASFILTSTSGGGAHYIQMKHFSASPATGDFQSIIFTAKDGQGSPADMNYGTFVMELVNISDGTEESKFEWFLRVSGAQNTAMTLSGAGVLDVAKYKVNGAAGANFSGVVSSITVVDGLVTAVS